MPSRRSQSGQVLLLALLLAAVGAFLLLAVFSSGQVLATRDRLVGAADAAALSAATWRARVLNTIAYTNRAIVAQEVALAQSVTLASWARHFDSLAGNAEALATLHPAAAALLASISSVAEVGREAAEHASSLEQRWRADESLGDKVLLARSQEWLLRSADVFALGALANEVVRATDSRFFAFALSDGGATGDYGTIFIAGASAKGRVNARTAGAEVIPQFTIAVEHYNRMCRLLQKGLPVRMALELRVSWSNETLEDHNVLAEIPGADPVIGNQFAMLGAHFDSWQSGTGTTDNGCGSAVVMEASRLLAAWCAKSGTKPRRTIRAALWSGEEQGLLGSRAWVAKHLGTAAQPGPEHGLVSGYFNLDNGTGRIRGVYLQGNEAIAPVFRAWLRPFHVHGASTVTLDDTGGTDHLAFHAVGIPGFQFIQDPVGYGTRTHHSNMDLWDHAVADDLKQASVIMASFAWHTAQRDALLPRPVR